MISRMDYVCIIDKYDNKNSSKQAEGVSRHNVSDIFCIE
jgi:hypothetical protein